MKYKWILFSHHSLNVLNDCYFFAYSFILNRLKIFYSHGNSKICFNEAWRDFFFVEAFCVYYEDEQLSLFNLWTGVNFVIFWAVFRYEYPFFMSTIRLLQRANVKTEKDTEHWAHWFKIENATSVFLCFKSVNEKCFIFLR